MGEVLLKMKDKDIVHLYVYVISVYVCFLFCMYVFMCQSLRNFL